MLGGHSDCRARLLSRHTETLLTNHDNIPGPPPPRSIQSHTPPSPLLTLRRSPSSAATKARRCPSLAGGAQAPSWASSKKGQQLRGTVLGRSRGARWWIVLLWLWVVGWRGGVRLGWGMDGYFHVCDRQSSSATQTSIRAFEHSSTDGPFSKSRACPGAAARPPSWLLRPPPCLPCSLWMMCVGWMGWCDECACGWMHSKALLRAITGGRRWLLPGRCLTLSLSRVAGRITKRTQPPQQPASQPRSIDRSIASISAFKQAVRTTGIAREIARADPRVPSQQWLPS